LCKTGYRADSKPIMKLWLLAFIWLNSFLCTCAQDGFIEGTPRLAYWQLTSPHKPIVIVIHGGPAVQHKYLRPEFDALVKTATVIYYDQRGCGKSDTASSYIWQQHVADLKRVIQTLAKNKKVFLAGSSWGSLLAMLYTYSHPNDVKGLILTGTVQWFGRDQPYERVKFQPSKLVRQTMFEKRASTKINREGQIEVDTLLVPKDYEINIGTTQFEPLESMKSAPLANHLKELKLPILLFTGTLAVNQKSGYRFDWVNHYLKLLPEVYLHTFNGAGHDPWLSDPDLFFSISNDFIECRSK
jgi:pimeloyl-ACP methyl ester carboxylesterase